MAGVDGDHEVGVSLQGSEQVAKPDREETLRLALAGHRSAQLGRRGTPRARGGHRRVLQREPDRPHEQLLTHSLRILRGCLEGCGSFP